MRKKLSMLLVASLLVASAARGDDQNSKTEMDIAQATMYSDVQYAMPFYGRTTYSLDAKGSDKHVTVDIHGQTVLKFEEGGPKAMTDVTGTIDTNGKIYTFNCHRNDTPETQAGIVGGMGMLSYSKKESLAHFVAWGGQGAFNKIPSHWVDKQTQETGDEDWFFEFRVPNSAQVGGSKFAAAMKDVENKRTAQVQDAAWAAPGGNFESAWKKDRTTGHFSAAMLGYQTGGNGFRWDNPDYVNASIKGEKPALIGGNVTAVWNVSTKPPEGDLVLEPKDSQGYDAWLPLPKDQGPVFEKAQPLTIHARVKPTNGAQSVKGRIDFYLQDVSKHKGYCGNYPKNGVDERDDLRFADKQAEGITLDSDDSKHAYTSKDVSEAYIVIESMDAGAYGKLAARMDDQGLTATCERTGDEFLRIPKDDNDNHIADKWEDDEGIKDKNYPATADEETDPFDAHKGDGLSIYDEYRGLVLRETPESAAKKYQRLTTKKKKVFLMIPEDDQNKTLFRAGVAVFATSTGFQLYYLAAQDGLQFDDSALGKSPYPHWINFNAKPDLSAEGFPKQYAIWIATKPPPKDWVEVKDDVQGYVINPTSGKHEKLMESTSVYARTVGIDLREGEAEIPQNVDYVGVFLQNAERFVDKDAADYDKMAQPGNTSFPSYRKAWTSLHDAGLISDDFKQIADHMRANKETIAKQLVQFCIVHELGHAVGAQHHHLKDALAAEPGKEQSFFAMGDRYCPMRYWMSDPALVLLFEDGKWDPSTSAPDGKPWLFCSDECAKAIHLRN